MAADCFNRWNKKADCHESLPESWGRRYRPWEMSGECSTAAVRRLLQRGLTPPGQLRAVQPRPKARLDTARLAASLARSSRLPPLRAVRKAAGPTRDGTEQLFRGSFLPPAPPPPSPQAGPPQERTHLWRRARACMGAAPGNTSHSKSSACASETYEFVESLLEVFVRHSIDDGVDEGVEISKPREKVKDGHVEPASVLANR